MMQGKRLTQSGCFSMKPSHGDGQLVQQSRGVELYMWASDSVNGYEGCVQLHRFAVRLEMTKGILSCRCTTDMGKVT